MNRKSTPDYTEPPEPRQPEAFRKMLSAVASKAASLSILATIVAVLWVAFSYARISLAGDGATVASPRVVDATVANVALGRREPLVYLTTGDANHYHGCGHNPSGGEREAVPASLARSRGLTPCPVCFKQ